MEESIISQIKNLSFPEKLLLVEEVWDDIMSSNPDLNLTGTQKLELDNRLSAYKKNPEKCLSWPEVKKRAKSKKW